jgi:uncharacterized protein YkwD
MSHFVSRLGPVMVALVVTAGLVVSSAPVEASAAGLKSRTALRCTTRHNVRHCVRVAVHTARATAVRHRTKPIVRQPQPKPKPLGGTTTTAVATAASRGLVAQEFTLVNADRKAAGLPALTESAALDRIATARAQDMVTAGYFGHYRPGDRTLAVLELLRANGVSFTWYGENIIWESGQPAASIANHFNAWWMNSPEHRANILNTHYGHIGIGVVTSGARVYMVEDFTN